MKRGYIGYGELGRQVAGLVETVHGREESVYFDDQCHEQGQPGAYPFAGYPDPKFRETSFFVCIGYKHLKKKRRSSVSYGPMAGVCRWWFTRPHSSMPAPGWVRECHRLALQLRGVGVGYRTRYRQCEGLAVDQPGGLRGW